MKNKLKDIRSIFDFNQMINRPTRTTSTTKSQIDLVFYNKSERIIKLFNFLQGSLITI